LSDMRTYSKKYISVLVVILLSILFNYTKSIAANSFTISGSIMHIHQVDGSLDTVFEIVIWEDFSGTLPDDIDSITITGPGGVLPYSKADFSYLSQWKDFALYVDGSPTTGEYTFTVTFGAQESLSSDTQSVVRIIPNVDTNFPADNAMLTTLTPTFSWQLVDFSESPIYYRLKIYDDNNYRIFTSPRTLNMSSLTIPADILSYGKTYTWSVQATDGGEWLEVQNRSESELKTFNTSIPMPWMPALLLD
jgi:hypothetical protein